MNWPSLLKDIQLFVLISNGPSILHLHFPMAKSFAYVCTSKDFLKSANLSMGGKDNLLLNSLKAW